MERVASGSADVAAIDCVSFAMAARHRPHVTDALRTIATSPHAPALPYVTSVHRSSAELNRLKQALADSVRRPHISRHPLITFH